jgi:hypothetical protein
LARVAVELGGAQQRRTGVGGVFAAQQHVAAPKVRTIIGRRERRSPHVDIGQRLGQPATQAARSPVALGERASTSSHSASAAAESPSRATNSASSHLRFVAKMYTVGAHRAQALLRSVKIAQLRVCARLEHRQRADQCCADGGASARASSVAAARSQVGARRQRHR